MAGRAKRLRSLRLLSVCLVGALAFCVSTGVAHAHELVLDVGSAGPGDDATGGSSESPTDPALESPIASGEPEAPPEPPVVSEPPPEPPVVSEPPPEPPVVSEPPPEPPVVSEPPPEPPVVSEPPPEPPAEPAPQPPGVSVVAIVSPPANVYGPLLESGGLGGDFLGQQRSAATNLTAPSQGSARSNSDSVQPKAANDPPPLPAPRDSSVSVPSSSSASASGHSSGVLAALIALLVLAPLALSRALRLLVAPPRPVALVFQLKRPG